MAISLDRARDFISSALKDDPTIFDGLDCHDQFDEIAQELAIDKTIVVEAYNQITSPPTKDAEKLQLLAGSEGFNNADEFMESYVVRSTVPGICMNDDCSYTSEYETDQTSGWCEFCDTTTVCSGIELYFRVV